MAKFNSLNRECLTLGFEEGFGRLMPHRSRDGEASLRALCKPLDFTRHSIHLQVFVDAIVPYVPGCIDHVPQYFVLKALRNVYITLLVQTPSWIP